MEELTALRRAAAFQIDPETAEFGSWYAWMEDPYNDGIYVHPRCRQTRREIFYRAPGSTLWIWWGDLPKATRDAICEKAPPISEYVDVDFP